MESNTCFHISNCLSDQQPGPLSQPVDFQDAKVASVINKVPEY